MFDIANTQDLSLLLTAGAGIVAGALSTWLWLASIRLKVRNEFLAELQNDMNEAFEEADSILADPSAPIEVRHALVRLLALHTSPKLGRKVAKMFLAIKAGSSTSESPLAEAMNRLHTQNRPMAQRAHHALLSLSMGLVVIHNADAMSVSKVQERTAKDPDSLWAQIGASASTRSFESDKAVPA